MNNGQTKMSEMLMQITNSVCENSVNSNNNTISTINGPENSIKNEPNSTSTTDIKDFEGKDTELDRSTIKAVLQFLKKHNLQETEAVLRKETQLVDETIEAQPSSNDVNSVLATFSSEGDPALYDATYAALLKYVESSLDVYKYELALLFYPVFVHMYLELVYNEHELQAKKFMAKYKSHQEQYYQDDIQRLASLVTKKEHMKASLFMDNFRSGQFTVRMCRDTYNYFKKHLQEKKNWLLQNIIKEHLYIDVYEGIARGKAQVESTSGAMVGEASRQANKVKILYGLLKEPDLPIGLEEEEEPGEGGEEKPKKKKIKKDPLLAKKSRLDPNAPPSNRIPLPELRDCDKVDRLNALREATKRVRVGPDSLPSICFYTFLNAHHGVTCASISEDATLLSAGFTDSLIRVWHLAGDKLKPIKPASELELIDKDADDVLYRIMDETKASDMKVLHGHTGPIYSTSFNPDKSLLLSCSEDATIRLWSLYTWTNIVCYRGHCFPVWDVKFSPFGYYFASCGHDCTARLWSTDSAQPLRIFAGHVSDVDSVQFHPNCNYVATGSSDRTVRLWDVVNGSCVRFMTGHKAAIYVLAFSPCGRFLASAGGDKKILMWDLAYGHLIAELSGHTDTIYSLSFSRPTGSETSAAILASGSLDYTVRIWHVQKLWDEIDPEDINIAHTPPVRVNCETLLLGTYPTKSTPPIVLHFTRRNLLLAAGMFQG